MSEHTKGPWERWHYSSTHLGKAFDIGADNNANVALVHNQDGEGVKRARRIVAAVNAFSGILTPDIEALGEGGVGEIREHFKRIRARADQHSDDTDADRERNLRHIAAICEHALAKLPEGS